MLPLCHLPRCHSSRSLLPTSTTPSTYIDLSLSLRFGPKIFLMDWAGCSESLGNPGKLSPGHTRAYIFVDIHTFHRNTVVGYIVNLSGNPPATSKRIPGAHAHTLLMHPHSSTSRIYHISQLSSIVFLRLHRLLSGQSSPIPHRTFRINNS